MTIIHVEDTFKAKDGFRLYEQCWMPEDVEKAKGVLVIVHGLAEHGGRYAHVGKFFAEHGFVVGAFDLRGHGKSDGEDTFFNSNDECVDDVEVFAARMHERVPGKSLFVLGHSMGGLIAAIYGIQKNPDLTGILLSGASLKISDTISPILVKIAGVLAKITPHMKTIVLDGNTVSRDPAVVEKYNTDPLNYRGGIPASTGGAINSATIYVREHFAEFNLPVRIMFGTEDRLADPEGSKKFYREISSTDKTMVPYEGLYHEILNEPEQEQVMTESLAWMIERL